MKLINKRNRLPLFFKDQINNRRQQEFDYAKFFAIIFMIAIHLVSYTNVSGLPSGYEIFIRYMILPFAAPVFMFAMGIGIVYAKNSSPKIILKRGKRMLVAALCLNILRDTLPRTLASW
ncbi:acyltransferase family protein, partial [Eubacterium aggregans]|uniref:acyltransferase family protein n=1 Tax=Eubacterium aggregans TaxID=81409 RepID=UPI003F2C18B9